MKKSELVSIVITTHARSDKIEYAIKSALGQTYKNIEVIVVDDNANNLTERRITEQIVRKYDNVRLIQNNRNMGGGPSRNVGINAAMGNLISFLDDDDQYLPKRIEKLLNLLEQHQKEKVGLVYCSCSVIDDNENIVGEYVNVENGQPFYKHMMGCIAGTSMWLAPKKALLDIDGFDDVPSKQDSTVILKLLSAGYKVFGTNEKLVLYYEHGGDGISGTKLSNADGIVQYRKKCRKRYGKINKKEIDAVECNFSRQLISIYLINDRVKLAKVELGNIWRYKPMSKIFFKNLAKILCRHLYLKRLKSNK